VEAAFFDLDKTVIAKASVVAFGTPLYREGLISRRTVLRGLWGQLLYLHLGADEARIARMRTSVLALTKGWDQTRVREIVEEALESVVAPIVYAEALELIRTHRNAGRTVVIVSASPEEIVVPLAHYLGVDAAIASRPDIDEHGRYTGTMAFDAFGANKVSAMHELAGERRIDLAESYAYSDSATDAPMLEAVGHPVAVNPDRELARLAAERGWEVRTFARPVQVRPVTGRAAPIAALGGTAALAAAAAWWWWARPRGAGTAGPSAPGRVVPMRAAARARGAASAVTAARPASGRRPPDWGAGVKLVDRARHAGRGQSTRSLRAATTPRATRMASRRSFFMVAG
jgi:HAD superfamily hydrolase (TIGR01490 family)